MHSRNRVETKYRKWAALMEPLKRIALANHADLVRIARAYSRTQRHYLQKQTLCFLRYKSPSITSRSRTSHACALSRSLTHSLLTHTLVYQLPLIPAINCAHAPPKGLYRTVKMVFVTRITILAIGFAPVRGQSCIHPLMHFACIHPLIYFSHAYTH